MASWLSILEFCREWKREIKRYGVALIILVSALCTGRWGVALMVPPAVFIMFAADRWGEPYRQRGASLTKKKKS